MAQPWDGSTSDPPARPSWVTDIDKPILYRGAMKAPGPRLSWTAAGASYSIRPPKSER